MGGVPIHCDSGERQLRMETILNQRQNDETEGVSSSVVGYQPTMALERARVVQLMRDAHTVASTSIFLKVEKTMSGHGAAVRASKGSANLSSFFAPESSQEGIESETRWALFLAKHNVAFLASDHASKLFKKIFQTRKSLEQKLPLS